MDKLLHFYRPTPLSLLPSLCPKSFIIPRLSTARRRLLCPLRANPVSLPNKPSEAPPLSLPLPLPPPEDLSAPPPLSPEDPHTLFREKMLFLDSIGIDLFALASSHPPIVSSSLAEIRSTIDFLHSMGFTPLDLRRICGMCPEVVTTSPRNLTQVFTFLLREARVQGVHIRRVVKRRPRLLVSDVERRLRPTLYFLQMLGITDTAKHATLLSCSVEDKLLPRIEYLKGAGFSPRDARAMVRRFPQLFCYSIEGNLEPKFDFFAVEMGRDLKELKDFPQYFSFSLNDRIRPRHQMCKEREVTLALPALLKPADNEFVTRMEVCASSSPPLRCSPLWHENSDSDL